MRFYELTHPEYQSDKEEARLNPLRMRGELYVPGVICENCAEETGGGWASSDRVQIDVPKGHPLRAYLTGMRLPVKDWALLVETIRAQLNVPTWMRVTPGAQIGLPEAELLAPTIPDFVHPFPGQFVVLPQVVAALKDAGITGFNAIPVNITWDKRLKNRPSQKPELFELAISGRAWRKNSDLETITACKVCSRTKFPNPEDLSVDEGRWDRSDLFTLDLNPNIVIVTERVCQTLERHGFSNYKCQNLL